jgi:hypothetical protein
MKVHDGKFDGYSKQEAEAISQQLHVTKGNPSFGGLKVGGT